MLCHDFSTTSLLQQPQLDTRGRPSITPASELQSDRGDFHGDSSEAPNRDVLRCVFWTNPEDLIFQLMTQLCFAADNKKGKKIASWEWKYVQSCIAPRIGDYGGWERGERSAGEEAVHHNYTGNYREALY